MSLCDSQWCTVHIYARSPTLDSLIILATITESLFISRRRNLLFYYLLLSFSMHIATQFAENSGIVANFIYR